MRSEKFPVSEETLQKEQEINQLTLEKEIDQLKLSQQKWTIGGLGLGLGVLSFLIYSSIQQKEEDTISKYCNFKISRRKRYPTS